MLSTLIGTWQGEGTAIYPTIDTTRYREILIFRDFEGKPIIQVEQKIWRIHDDGSESLLHWESGFIRELEDGYEWINAQSNGRTEVLKGRVQIIGDNLELNFGSIGFMNDPRMVQSGRTVTVNGNSLTYKLSMATQVTAEYQTHLEAALSRRA
ncbi:MAG: FABP family protein [Chloroflexi bacterium]|nr:FABP family protein [Chloroflexota bacterium]